MSLKLSSPVTEVSRIGPAKAQYLQKLKILHVRDFLYTFPRRYDDFSNITPIGELVSGKKMTVKAKVKKVVTNNGWRGRRRMLRIFVDLEDDTGVLNVTWYNLRFLQKQLWQGREMFVAGTIEENLGWQKKLPIKTVDSEAEDDKSSSISRYRMRSPVIEFSSNQDPTHTGRIIPVYPETYGVTSRFLRYQVKNLLPLLGSIPEYLPAQIIKRNKLMGVHEAIKQAHFPTNADELELAQTRLRFDELFFLQLAALVRRQKRKKEKAMAMKLSDKELNKLIGSFPFSLTRAQKRSIKEITLDLNKSSPMNRLLQGDVGSGKSAVALVATQFALLNNYKVFYLAPTEILARQQAKSFAKHISSSKVSLMIGSSTKKEREDIFKKLSSKQPHCVVGTHAIINENISVRDLALTIVDEQHRFGVKQRKALQDRNDASTMPHLLSMTATPIPRTLNLTFYGDLDISVLDEMPPGRQPIKTKIIMTSQREQAITHVLEELHAGRQAYVISPLVEKSEKLQVKSAEETVVEMRQYFPGIAIELVHGRMKSNEKQSIMNNFHAGSIQLLVSTAVVEVGVDVPNATCMIIEGAERFGLAQLHQFRGRIGRGDYQSFCYLFPSTDESASNERLSVLSQTIDGFKIAEADLSLRGPGEVYGKAQSGFGDLQVASLLDYGTIKLARSEAEKILDSDPELKEYLILRKKVEQKNLIAHFE
jgi:ATP-dependent DNA helicase RecG